MDGGLLSLRWNSHKKTFSNLLSSFRKQNTYSDVSIACDGKIYEAHKLVLATCSDFFKELFEATQCKHPVIVLTDIRSEVLETLLDYMYIGEVIVSEDRFPGLIKAADHLRVKGLAIIENEDELITTKLSSREKRNIDNDEDVNSEAKRHRQDSSSSSNGQPNNRIDKAMSIAGSRLSGNNLIINNTELSSGRDSPQPLKDETEDDSNGPDLGVEVTIDEHPDVLKQESGDTDTVTLSDSNSATDTAKDLLLENFGVGQHHFMDELLGHSSGPNQLSQAQLISLAGVRQLPDNWNTTASAGANCSDANQNFTSTPTASTSSSAYPHPSTLPPFDEMISQLQPNAEGLKYTCPVCGRGSADKYDLKRHYMVHTGEKPNGCPYCPYRAVQKSAIYAHIRMKHSSLNSNPTVAYPPNTLLPFDEMFDQLEPNSQGMKYTCPGCSRGFNDKSEFRRHYMVHSGEKPYNCPYCPFRVVQKAKIKPHIRKKHPDVVLPEDSNL